MKIEVRKSRVLRNLFIAIGILLLGNFFAIYLEFNTVGLEAKVSRLLIKLFNVNHEANLPTYFSALVLLADAILLAIIGYGCNVISEKCWHWFGMSFVFIFISLDEMIQIHEQFRAPMETLFNTTGLLYFAWFIPYIVVVLILGVVYFKFMIGLPRPILKLFVLAAVVFISGAVGMEAVGGKHAEIYGEDTLTYALMYSFEEFLEMVGGAIFFYALISCIDLKFKTVQFTFANNKSLENK